MRHSILEDLKYAWRSVAANPKLALSASACAAVGLAAAVFMVAIVHAVLLAAPPLPDADHLVRVWTSSTTTRETSDVSYPEFLDIQARARSFDAVEAASRTRLAVTTEAGTERLRGESVTPGYFAMVGVRPAVGRLFSAAEYAPNADRPVIISYDLWQRRFGGRREVIGQPFRTRPTSRQTGASVRTIVGVMPRGFVGTVDPDVADFWLPIAHYEPAPILADRMTRSTWMLARLAPNQSLAGPRSEIAGIAAALAAEQPGAYDRVTLAAEPFGESWRGRFRLSLYTLFAAAGLLLLIACANVATLLLARLAARQGELRVRAALGAPPARVRRQLLIESLIIAGAGGIAGVALAAFAVRAVAASGAFALPPYVAMAIDLRVAFIGMLLIALTGLLFGALPARVGASERTPLTSTASTRVSMGIRERRYGRVLVVTQVAFTFLLLTGATLLFRTYQKLVGDDLGYRTQHLLRMAITPDPAIYSNQGARVALAAEIKRTFESYPGVRTAAVMAGVLPPWFDDVADVAATGDARLRDVGRHAIGPDFFEVMGMTLVGGRGFDLADRVAGADTALASESLARRLGEMTGRPAIGERVTLTTPGMPGAESLEIVGVVNDVVYNGPLRPRAAHHDLYVPLELGGAGALSLAIHTDIDPAALIDPLSRELGRLAPTSPQHWISTMEGELALQYRDARLYASLSGICGAAAAIVAVLGLSSTLSHHVARRRRELGVRLAFGARGVDVVRLILFEGARTLTIGVLVGVALALGVTRWLASLLYGVAPNDPVTYLVVAAALLLSGLCACAIPSIRAGRVDPVEAIADRTA